MNGAIHFTLSIFLVLHITAASPVAKMRRNLSLDGRTNHNEVLSNNVDHYGYESEENVRRLSDRCVYYNYQDKCHKSNDGCPKQIVKCSETFSRHRGCFVMWKGDEKILQGCWSPSPDQGCTRECSDKRDPEEQTAFNFCCCHGDNCNEKYGLAKEIPMRQ